MSKQMKLLYKSSETQKWLMWSPLSVTPSRYWRQSQALHSNCVFLLTTFPLSTGLCNISQKLFVKLLSRGLTSLLPADNILPETRYSFRAPSCLCIASQILCPLSYVLTFWRRNYFFFNFSTTCILNVNNTGTKYVPLIQWRYSPTGPWPTERPPPVSEASANFCG